MEQISIYDGEIGLRDPVEKSIYQLQRSENLKIGQYLVHLDEGTNYVIKGEDVSKSVGTPGECYEVLKNLIDLLEITGDFNG